MNKVEKTIAEAMAAEQDAENEPAIPGAGDPDAVGADAPASDPDHKHSDFAGVLSADGASILCAACGAVIGEAPAEG